MLNSLFKIPFLFCLFPFLGQAQAVHEYKDSLVVSTNESTVMVNNITGKVDYHFSSGSYIINTVAYIEDIRLGYFCSADFKQHLYSTEKVEDSIGKGIQINIKHVDDAHPMFLVQHITLYNDQSYLLADVEAVSKQGKTFPLETRNISPLAILPSQQGRLFMPGDEPRILDVPFDNDDWVDVLERKWHEDKRTSISGISYECSSVYDNITMNGIVTGSVTHDFWKTGIAYKAGNQSGIVDSFNVFGGAATPDDKSLPANYGGLDGTHDHGPHGTMLGASVHSPIIYLCGLNDVRKAFTGFGEANAMLNGRLYWKGFAPVYWNSFGVEGVLGYEGVMMPAGVAKIVDFIHTLKNFNVYAKPVLSVDSYDQGIYTTELLTSLGQYAKKKDQQMGFYFIPFAIWTWKNDMDKNKLKGSDFC